MSEAAKAQRSGDGKKCQRRFKLVNVGGFGQMCIDVTLDNPWATLTPCLTRRAELSHWPSGQRIEEVTEFGD